MAKKRLGPTTNLYPMPAVLVAVRTGESTTNIMTVAWAGIVGSPPLIALRIGGFHHTAPHLEREGNFSVNIPSSAQVVGVDYCGVVSGRDDPDKAATCGWTLAPCKMISSPLIVECPLNLECRLTERIAAGKGAIYLAEILETHVDEAVLGDDGLIDAKVLDPLIFANSGHYYALGEHLGKAWEIGKRLIKEGATEDRSLGDGT